MKRYLSILLVSILLISSNIYIVNSENVQIHETITKETITKGLQYEHREIFTQAGWVDIHVLIMDLSEEQVALKVLRSNDAFGIKETMTALATKDTDNVVGGINGSFFNMSLTNSDPTGLEYDNGYTYISQDYNVYGKGAASLIQKTNGDVLLDYFSFSMKITNALDVKIPLSGINKLAIKDVAVVYNRNFGANTSLLDSKGKFYKLEIVNDKVKSVTNPGVSLAIPSIEEGFIIAIPEAIAATYLPDFIVGTDIKATYNTSVNANDIRYAISGGGKIIENGKVVQTGVIIEPNSRHPRTAIGITADGTKLISMVIDGRGKSIGATHNELANYLLKYNVSDAIHFDGGGSSTLLGREIGTTGISDFNSPSGGSERKVLNGLAFVSLAEPGELASMTINADTKVVFKNNPIHLELIGLDSNYNPVTVDNQKVVWYVEGIKGTWETNTFYPSTSGTGTLICSYEGVESRLTIKSLDTPIDLSVSPRVLSLDYNSKGSFKVTGLDSSGFEGTINNNDVVYTVENPAIGSFVNGSFVSGSTTGITKVKIQVGDRWTTTYVAVGNEKQTLKAFEAVTFTNRVYPEVNITGKTSPDYSNFVDTAMSFKMEYKILASPDAQAIYMMIDNFMIQSPTDIISLQLKGNQSGHSFKGKVIDAKGRVETITFADEINFTGWKEVTANLPKDLSYPIRLERLYLVAIQSVDAFSGSINFDQLSVMSNLNTSTLKFDQEGFINDPMRLQTKPDDDFELKVFGPTAFRNRLLDNILMEKVYENLNASDYGVFAGTIDVSDQKVSVNYKTWKNKYEEYSVNGVKLIHLATTSGGIRSTDYTQYDKLRSSLQTTSENTIIVIGNKNPLTSFTDAAEGALLHKMLKDFQDTTGKTIMYINAGGYVTDVTIRDGIRYFDLSGIWYKTENRYVDLNKTFYTLNFYIKSGEVNYMIEPLYPLIEVAGE